MFIGVSINEEASGRSEVCRNLVALCPVDIFTIDDGRVTVDDDRTDECTLCGLCWERLPDVVTVDKLY